MGPRHSCGWEPRLEANRAAAVADATTDAASPLHTHPPSSYRQAADREPGGGEGELQEGLTEGTEGPKPAGQGLWWEAAG